MDHHMSDSNVPATTSHVCQCATCKIGYPTADSVRDHFARLEERMDRIEGALNTILDRLPTSNDAEAGKKRPRVDFSAARGEQSRSQRPLFGTPTTNYGQQPPVQESAKIANEQYCYTPLDSTKSQVRLLKLREAQSFAEPLVANLEVVSLDDIAQTHRFGRPIYAGLSYTWGNSVFEGLIIIDGYRFPITKGLEAALKQLRPMSGAGNPEGLFSSLSRIDTYWVDQICIDQSSLDERATQVNLMRRIYKMARSIKVWLGEEADDSSLAIKILKTMGNPPRRAPGEKDIQYPSYSEEDIIRHWDALRALFRRPWWKRVWIRQEIALHRDVQLWCGSENIEMGILRLALSMLTHVSAFGYRSSISYSDDESTVVLPWDYHARKLLQLQEMTEYGEYYVGLAQLLRITRSCEASDPHDMVFAILGMADPEMYPIVPNYRQGVKSILLSTVQLALGQKYGLEILGACQNPEKKEGLPSWIPLLSDKWRAIPFQSLFQAGPFPSPNPFQHPADRFLTKAESPTIKVQDDVLSVRGGLVDVIVSICGIFVKNNSHIDDIETVYKAWQTFATDAWKDLKLSSRDGKTLIESHGPEKARNWVRFLTVLTESGDNLFRLPNEAVVPGGLMFGQKVSKPNPKLSRCYLLPSSHTSAEPHPNHKIHAGLQSYGVGRRLALTQKGFLALVPSETRIRDHVALFQGATYPYILRKTKQRGNQILVGEAFIPNWLLGWTGDRAFRFGEDNLNAESWYSEKWKLNVDSWIRIC